MRVMDLTERAQSAVQECVPSLRAHGKDCCLQGGSFTEAQRALGICTPKGLAGASSWKVPVFGHWQLLCAVRMREWAEADPLCVPVWHSVPGTAAWARQARVDGHV